LFNLENNALNEYAHMVSHDLKAPLRSIDTLINWFIQDNESLMNEANLKSLNKILLNVEKMDSLIAGILNYSSIENHTHEERVIDVNLVVQDFLKTIEVPDNANINITNKLPVLREMILD
jgi:light-regulated signal transduction histidine kinase (bacteriophytochrome)